jgi:hypothetical protein
VIENRELEFHEMLPVSHGAEVSDHVRAAGTSVTYVSPLTCSNAGAARPSTPYTQELGHGAHVLRVRAQIHSAEARLVEGGRWAAGEGSGRGQGAQNPVLVAERLILFRVCPVTVGVSKLFW